MSKIKLVSLLSPNEIKRDWIMISYFKLQGMCANEKPPTPYTYLYLHNVCVWGWSGPGGCRRDAACGSLVPDSCESSLGKKKWRHSLKESSHSLSPFTPLQLLPFCPVHSHQQHVSHYDLWQITSVNILLKSPAFKMK